MMYDPALKSFQDLLSKLDIKTYRGSPPYAHFGTWKKTCYMKFVLVNNGKIPHLHVHKPKTMVVETVLEIFMEVGTPRTITFE